MKKILISIIFGILSLNALFAQETSIPDSNFEQALIDLGIDSDKTVDGKVLTDDIKFLTQLIINNKNIESLKGIESFDSLTNLYCSNNNLTTLDLSNNLNLEKLDCSSNSITTISVSNSPNLITFDFSSNQISSIDLSENSSLTSLKCSSNRLTNLLVNNNTKLQQLFFSENQIESINVQNNPLLRFLICSSNQLKDLNLSENDSIRIIDFSNNQLKTIDVTNNTFLTNISGSNNQLSELNLIKNDSLYYLNIAYNQINSIDLSNNNNLENLICGSNQLDNIDGSEYLLLKTIDVSNNLISTIDLTQNDAITSIDCSDNPIETLNVKNGNNSILSTFNATDLPNLFCIQIDDTNAIGNYWTKDVQARYSEDCSIDETYIPDDNFEQTLIDLNIDDILDDYVLTSNINTINNLDISAKSITDLTGIDDFTNLLSLNCSGNNLTSISLPLNLLLTSLDCSSNKTTDLDVTTNTNLSYLNCSDNLISTLNLKNNTVLTELDATINPNLSCITVEDENAANSLPPTGIYTNWLKDDSLIYYENCLHPGETYVPDSNFEQVIIDRGLDTVLDGYVLTKSIDTIKVLNINNKTIEDLTGIEDFIELDTLNCSNNSLRFLNVSNQPNLISLNCSSNQLVSLTLGDVPNGTLEHLDATTNLLTCIKVNNAANAESEVNWFIDSSTLYSESDCIPDKTSIPDSNFEQVLIDLGYDSGSIDGYVTTYNINTVNNLDISDKNIQSLTGIEDFISLDSLNCSENNLLSIDISKNVNLKKLTCNDNFLTNLNVENNILLTNLICGNNNISTLNTNSNTNLIELVCNANELTEIDVSKNSKLILLKINSNHITSTGLDISNNTNLEELYCSNNKLRSIDIGLNKNLIKLKCAYNYLSYIDLTTNTFLEELDCSQNYLTSLNLENNTYLNDINCDSNEILDLNFDTNLLLTNISCNNNKISSISLINNIDLNTLECDNNELTSLDIQNNTKLDILSATYNIISTIELNSNTILSELYMDNNLLTNINVSTNIELTTISVSYNALNTIDLSTNTLLEDLNINQNELLVLDVTANTALESLNCTNNEFETLDFISNTSLSSLNCYSNKLQSLDLKNGQNQNLSTFNATYNEDLFCIEVDDPDNINSNWRIDATASYSANCKYSETYIPDDNFEQTLINLGYDTDTTLDNYVPTSNIESIKTLDISNQSIENIIGIEDFTNLDFLNCSLNNIDTLDVSKNLNLTELICSNNNLDSLNVTSNSLLKVLTANNNILTKLTTSSLENLETLNVNSNLLASLYLNTNTSLISLNCNSNELATLDLDDNTNLTTLDCSSNLFTKIELNALTSLASLNCSSNLLITLTIKNGNNTSLTTFNATNNTNLFCIEVDDPTFSNNATGWQKDTQAEYNEYCHYFQTYIPDDEFEQKIINLGLDSGPVDDYVPTADIEIITSLNLSNLGVVDLTGIEDFLALTNLDCSNNQIINLEPNKLTKLTILNCSNNLLTNLNTTEIPNLKTLICNTNILSSLYINDNLDLTYLDCSDNSLSNLEISKLINLSELDCSTNQITSIDISDNSNITILNCSNNIITNLNLQNTNNQLISSFDARNNPDLLCVLVDDIDASKQYANWYIDSQSYYKLECNDDDNDGVSNTEDQCLNTPLGDFVDLFGCSVFTLPTTNFTIITTSETCSSSNNGKVTITAIETYNYTATIIGEGINKTYNFTNSVEIRNLRSGTYQLCFTIDIEPNYILCFDVIITEPEELLVASKISKTNSKVWLELSGANNYTISHNNLIINTESNLVQLNLYEGENTISVKTDLDCQGTYNETIFLSDEVIMYPNPFNNYININIGSDTSKEAIVKIYNNAGQLITSKLYVPQNGNIYIDTSQFPSGIYFVSLISDISQSTFKIIKK